VGFLAPLNPTRLPAVSLSRRKVIHSHRLLIVPTIGRHQLKEAMFAPLRGRTDLELIFWAWEGREKRIDDW